MANYRSRNRNDNRRRRSRDTELTDDESDDLDYDYPDRENNFGWIVVVVLIGAGIFWLARLSNSHGLPPAVRTAAQGNADSATTTTGGPATDLTAGLGKPRPKPGQKEPQAIAILKSVADTYRQLESYEDITRMQLRYPVGNQIQEENAELSFKFQRPNRVRLEVEKEGHRVVVTNDGNEWNSRIIDPTTQNFDNQFVVAQSEGDVTVNSVYSATEYVNMDRPNELLNALMSLPAPLLVSQIAFVLEPDSLDQMVATSLDIRQLTPQSMQGRNCERIRVRTEGGSFVFWIDERQKLVRRIQFPTADRQPGDPTSHLGKSMLQCDYGRLRTDARFSNDTFTLAKPESARLVRNFILPPQSDPDTILNQQVGGFWFTDLRNQRTPPGYWEDKVSLFVWWNNHPACRVALDSLAATYERFKDDQRVSMLAVSSIPSTQMSHAQVQQLAEQWKIALPVVRDTEAFGRDTFQVSQAPTVVIVDSQGRVQLQETTANPDLGTQMQTVIEKILAGENIAEQYLTFLDSRGGEYEKLLAAASLEEPKLKLKPALPELSPATLPSQLTVRELWKNDRIRQPGNILALKRGLRHELLVHDGTDSLVQLSTYGSVKDEFKLPTPNGPALMTNLRVASDRSGAEYYLATAAMGDQTHLFDERWQHLMSYPDTDAATRANPADGNAIQDAQIADMDGDGELEVYVAFDGTGGVHRVNRRGKREWTNESVAPVYSLSISPDNTGRSYLLVTNDRGKVAPLDHEGAPKKPIEIPSWSIHHLMAAPVIAGVNSGYCAVSQLPDGSLVAIGLSPAMSELWDEPLSSGTFRSPVDFVQTASWNGGQPYWLIATPEGAIHVVSQDGQLHDRFQTGKTIRGLAGFETNDSNVLVVSAEDGVTAWEVDLPK
jgi:outer membrane lipoprotein-sorting protein